MSQASVELSSRTIRSMETPRQHQRELVLVAVTVIGLSRLLDGPLLWPVAALLLGAMLLGSLQVLGEGHPAGVPIEALVPPSVAAVSSLGAIRLIPLGLGLVPALILAALLVERAIATEARLLDQTHGPTASDRTWLVALSLLIGFLAFTGVAAIIPGGLVEVAVDGAPVPPLSESNLLFLAAADALVAGLLGYRLAALRVTALRDAFWSAGSYAGAIAIGAAAVRAMAIPRLLGPALLTLILFLWDTFRGASPSLRRDPGWIWQLALLVVLAVAVVGWNLQLPR